MANSIEFDVVLFKDDNSTGVGIKIPFDTMAVFGKKGRIYVKYTIDGIPLRGSLSPMSGCHFMVVKKDTREKIGKTAGDTVHIYMEEDFEERIVPVPEDFQKILDANPDAKAIFEKQSYTHKKEYVEAINDAKKPETRIRRMNKAIDELLKKRK